MHDCVNQLHVDEVDLRLRRMNIDVDFLRIYLNIKEIAGETILRNEFFVSVFHCMMQICVLDETTVHKEILLASRFLGKLRFNDETFNSHRLCYLVDWQQLTVVILSEKSYDTLF